MLRKFILCGFLLSIFGKASACWPLPDRYWEETPERVQANFEEAKFVVIANVVKVIKKPTELPLNEIEVATFKVEHSFKGNLKSGSTFIVETGHTSCAKGVLDNNWRVPPPPLPGKSLPRELLDPPRKWLIYYTPRSLSIPFEIQDSPLSRPVHRAAYDLDILKRYSRQWKQ